MRIITGKAKGTKLEVPEGIRPITDRVKTVMFDIFGSEIKGKKVIDLFAGSGNIGIEALSRGADLAIFYEKDPDNINVIKQNLMKTGFSDKAKIIETNLLSNDFRISYKDFEQFYIFADPPFNIIDQKFVQNILSQLSKLDILVLKLPTDLDLSPDLFKNYQVAVDKKIGVNRLLFINTK